MHQVIIAIQNQTSVDFAMAVRIMTEDALDYNMQCRMKHGEKLHKRDRLILVITVVFYHGGTRLTGGWKEIFEVLQRQTSEKKMREYLTEKKEDHRNLPEDTKKLIFALLGKSEYYEEMTKKGEVAELCKAFDDHYKSGERKGRQEGRRMALKRCVRCWNVFVRRIVWMRLEKRLQMQAIWRNY